MRLKDIMTHEVHAVSPQESLRHAAQKMKSWDIGALPVCQNDKLIGLITDRDIAVRAVAEGRNPESSCVSDAMTCDLVFCYEDASRMPERPTRFKKDSLPHPGPPAEAACGTASGWCWRTA